MIGTVNRLNQSQRKVLDVIWRQGSCSRAEIAQRAGFTRPAISQIVSELSGIGLLEEQPVRRGMRGQPARPVQVKASAAFCAGFNFSHSYIELVLLDLGGNIVGSTTASLPDRSPQTIVSESRAMLDALIFQHSLAPNRLLGAGICLPGDFDTDGSLIPHRLFPEIAGTALPHLLGDALNTAIHPENDGRACAIGERVMGVGRESETFMLVHLGHGVGGGIIVEGKPFRGALGNAGILGQYYPYGAPRPSGLDLLETLRAAGRDVEDFDALEQIDTDHSVVAGWIARAAAQLSGDLARISRFFGPEAVVIAGRLPTAITARLAAAIDFKSVLRPLDDLPIVPVKGSALGLQAGAIGAASLVIFHALFPNERAG